MTLDEARGRVGSLVVYRREYCAPEEGVITSVNDQYVFVRYGSQQTSQATDPRDLEFTYDRYFQPRGQS
jgi:hypothetical protein